jgi:energy-coupling factor transport system ATP-binding protein
MGDEYVNRLIVMDAGHIAYDDTPRKVFAGYRELEKMGLAAPQVTYIMHELKKNGFDVDTSALTVNEAKEEILKCI